MTEDQRKQVEEVARELKGILVGFTGSITFNLSANVLDIKYDVREMGVAKKE
jgi:CRISPR/Cas system endoribonuclease Cas6 (RAMP superfamily)